jgi:hypothetical protein
MHNRKETLANGYYTLALDMLDRIVGICRQAGIDTQKMNAVWVDDGVELEGLTVHVGVGRNFSFRAARHDGADHRSNAGIVVSEKQVGILGRARISVLYEPAHSKWSFYAQIQPGCRSSELIDLCNKLSIDLHTETSREIGENEAFTTILTTAQWAAKIIVDEHRKAQ